jgi:hypothetical protein
MPWPCRPRWGLAIPCTGNDHAELQH